MVRVARFRRLCYGLRTGAVALFPSRRIRRVFQRTTRYLPARRARYVRARRW